MDISLNILGRGFPIKRAHGEIIVFSAVNSKLLFKVVKRKNVSGIKIFIVFAVRALGLAVVPRRVGADELGAVPHTGLRRASNSVGVGLAVYPNLLVNSGAIVGLNTLALNGNLASICSRKTAEL